MSPHSDPVDTGLSQLDRPTLERLLANFREGAVTDVYRLSPLQEGMLFETLQRPGEGDYLTQSVYDVDRALDPETFIAAWRFVRDRHDALRTTFVYEGVPHPVQVVHRTVPAQVRVHDWSDRSEERREAALDRLLRERRRSGPELTEAPPLGFDLIELDGHRFTIVWHVHHLLIDGASSAQVLDELASAYASLAERAEFPKLPEPVRFKHHIAWLANRDRSEDVEEWREVVGDLAEPSTLSCIAPPAEDASHAADSIVRTLDRGSADMLADFAKRHHCTLHTLLQAAWALVLATRSGTSDVCWGTIFSGRSSDQAHLEDVVGLVINTVPARIRVDPDATVKSWLGSVQQMLAKVHRIEHVGLDGIRRASAVPGGEDLFQTLFQYVPRPPHADDSAPRLGMRLTEAREQTGYPLDLSVVMRDELTVHLSFERARVDGETAGWIVDQYEHLLRELAANEDTVLAELATLPPAERERLAAWSRPASWKDSSATVPDLFARAAREFGDATAVIGDGGSLTYRELDRRSDLVAAKLAASGVRAETTVGIAMPRTTELIPLLLGVLKAGGAYLVLDPETPRERLRLMLDDSAPASVVAAATGFDPRTLPAHCEVLAADALLEEAPGPPGFDRAALHPDSLAFVTYTSGSTGVPKRVGLTHRNLVKIGHRPDYYTSGPGRRFLQLAPIGFDASIEEIWGALLNGASLVMPHSTRMDIPDIADLIRRYEVTTVSMTTGLFHQFVDQDAAALRGLDELVIGGEAARRAQCDRLVGARPGPSLVNTYGPTETTCTTTSAVVHRDPDSEVPIGRPIAGTVVYVLDRDLNQVPAGVNGELYAGGTGVTRGYLNDPGLTAATFVPDPFSAEPGARMYATGDTVRWLPDGRLEFVGRADRQVKVRGFRVEPGEVEAKLAEHPGLRDAVVEAVEDGTGLKRLVAYVVREQGAAVTREGVGAFIAERLPRYMAPSLVVFLEKIPLTASGKVDRARLGEDVEAIPPPEASRAARTATERALAAAWKRFLDIGEPGAEDNFFDLGGDSILAMRVASAVRQAGLALSSTDLFKYQTIGELAPVLDARSRPEPADQGRVTGEVRPTPIQRWFLDHYGIEDRFNQSRLLRWSDAVSAPALRTALRALVDHHDVLRLRVTADGGEVRQWIAGPDDGDPLEVRDLRSAPAEDLDAELERVGDAVQGGLDLKHGPVIRAALIRTRSGCLLFMAIHHLAVDLVSWSILLEDLEAAYRMASQGEAVVLPPKTSSFKAWSDHLHDAALSPGFASHRDFWREPEGRTAPIPADEAAAEAPPGADLVRFSLSREETRRFLHATQGRKKVTGPELILGAAVPAFREWARGRSVLVDLETHGRESSLANLDVTRTVGWFTAAYPVRLDTEAVDTLGGYVGQIRDQTQSDQGRALGYGIAKHLTGPDADDFPDAEVCFNYLGELRSGNRDGALFTEQLAVLGAEYANDRDPAYPLDIASGVADGRLFVDIAYARRRWLRGTVQDFADSLLAQLRRAIGQLATWEMDRSHPSSWLARLRQDSPLLTAPMKRYGVPGISVATITGGRVATWAHGRTGREDREVDERTLFQTGSVAKHLAAITVLRLCEQGLLELDQPFNDLPVDVKVPAFDGGGSVTVRHLLAHRSGLAVDADSADGLRAVRPAGHAYEYALVNYSTIELMLAQLTRSTFAEALGDHVFGPLGLEDSALLPLYPGASDLPRVAAGHSATGRRYERPRRSGSVPAGPELWSCAGDIAAVGADLHRAIAGDEGVLLRRESALQMLAGLRSGYGLGTVVKQLNSMLWIGHPGDGPGFRTIYAVDAYEGHGLVLLANGDGATPLFEDLLVELGTDLVMRVQGSLMVWEKG